jgi:hypothetical protein
VPAPTSDAVRHDRFVASLLPPAIASLICLALGAGTAAAARAMSQHATLTPVAALPAHIAGSFEELTGCHQTADGEYLLFDRRAHSVYSVMPGLEAPKKLVEIGTEPGRVLDPTAFDVAPDGSFVVADAPWGQPRIQRFMASGHSLDGFLLKARAVPRIVLGNLVLNGIAALEYTGMSVLVSQPEQGGVISEYGTDGRPVRTFGTLRPTTHESDPAVHIALNAGIVIAHPRGGFYFVFLAGVPQFRKYDASGRLEFERHVEGVELDAFIQALPTTWKRKKTEDGLIPLVLPSVYAAGADRAGNLWISLAPGITYVYGSTGDKQRLVRFRAAGAISPTSFSFTRAGRVLVTPGCYAFPAG